MGVLSLKATGIQWDVHDPNIYQNLRDFLSSKPEVTATGAIKLPILGGYQTMHIYGNF